jgi:uncharacterized protein (DUF1800 family)
MMRCLDKASGRFVLGPLAALVFLAGPCAQAQDSPAPAGMTAAQVWRATSRLGYAPTPAFMPPAGVSPVDWSRQQLAAARADSQRAPRMPAEAAATTVSKAMTLSMPDILAGVLAEREQRKLLQQAAVELPAGQGSRAPADARNFTPDMRQGAAAWRLMACSDPALENPLLARMTEFWFNHFNVFAGKGQVGPFVGHYLLNAIRPHALGRFEDLLLASARHPAMLFYLDQTQSNSRGLNENYAREVMELHTLGVDGGYAQADVRELARILTGWTVDLQGGTGFRFAERQHDKDSKQFMGRLYVNQGLYEGEEALRYLARQPATAKRISMRLARFFVSDQPPQALVNRLVRVFLSSQGNIQAMMNSLIESPEFWAADQALFKTPLDFACSALAVGGGVRERRDLAQSLAFLSQAGQPMNGWQTPDGYSSDAATWLAPEALTRRADHALNLAQRMAEPDYLNPFLSSSTRERVGREDLPLRTGLMLASPEFMRK